MDKLLSEKQVTDIVGFKRTKLYQMIKKGDFPAPKNMEERTGGLKVILRIG